jgi:uncharacterized metal-binding protein|tara:strand:- start:151 stop:390 length:240 start_codon:yes stop_codon:yes gene_type:complete
MFVDIIGTILDVLLVLAWFFIFPLIIFTAMSLFFENLYKHKVINKPLNDESLAYYYIGWFFLLWLLDSQGYPFSPADFF